MTTPILSKTILDCSAIRTLNRSTARPRNTTSSIATGLFLHSVKALVRLNGAVLVHAFQQRYFPPLGIEAISEISHAFHREKIGTDRLQRDAKPVPPDIVERAVFPYDLAALIFAYSFLNHIRINGGLLNICRQDREQPSQFRLPGIIILRQIFER